MRTGARRAAFGRFCDWLRALYQLEMPNFIDRNYDSPARPRRGRSVRRSQLVRLGALRQARARGARGTSRDERLRRLFSFQSMYAGLAPYEALAIYAVITYMDAVSGVYVPDGGMHAVPVALATGGGEGGRDVPLRHRVERILRQPHGAPAAAGARACGSRDGERDRRPTRWSSTPTCPVAYRTLLPDLAPPRAVRRAAYSPSAFVWHVGVRGRPAERRRPPQHPLRRASGTRPSGRCSRDGRRMPDPSMLVTVPTLDEPALAPAGSSVLYVLEPVPNLDGAVDWTRASASRPRDRLAALVGVGYPTDVVVEELVDPIDWERAGHASGHAVRAGAPFFQTGPFRPANVDRARAGPGLRRRGTVPGVGVPMVLVSGRLAAERVEPERRREP